MNNESNPLQPAKITKSVSPLSNDRFDVVTLNRNTDKSEKILAKSKYIVVLPFERTADNKIAYVYAVKAPNHVTDKTDVTLVIDSIDPEKDQTAFDSVGRALLEEAGLNIDEAGVTEDDIFYIGTMSISEPVTANFKCYAVDLTKISRPDEAIAFTTTLSKSAFTRDSSEIVKIGFHQIVNGDYSDVTILSGSFLLVSYFQ